MASKILTNAALFVTIAQAVHTREALIEESSAWEFVQVWQDKSVNHTCQAAHDRVKATPKFDKS